MFISCPFSMRKLEQSEQRLHLPSYPACVSQDIEAHLFRDKKTFSTEFTCALHKAVMSYYAHFSSSVKVLFQKQNQTPLRGELRSLST